jgi:hypothetical protein
LLAFPREWFDVNSARISFHFTSMVFIFHPIISPFRSLCSTKIFTSVLLQNFVAIVLHPCHKICLRRCLPMESRQNYAQCCVFMVRDSWDQSPYWITPEAEVLLLYSFL